MAVFVVYSQDHFKAFPFKESNHKFPVASILSRLFCSSKTQCLLNSLAFRKWFSTLNSSVDYNPFPSFNRSLRRSTQLESLFYVSIAKETFDCWRKETEKRTDLSFNPFLNVS